MSVTVALRNVSSIHIVHLKQANSIDSENTYIDKCSLCHRQLKKFTIFRKWRLSEYKSTNFRLKSRLFFEYKKTKKKIYDKDCIISSRISRKKSESDLSNNSQDILVIDFENIVLRKMHLKF